MSRTGSIVIVLSPCSHKTKPSSLDRIVLPILETLPQSCGNAGEDLLFASLLN